MFAAIMAGGSGTRFWPASTPARPKQFLSLFGGRTMLEHTMDRLSGLAGGSGVAVICGGRHETIARPLVSTAGATLIVEPFGRNTAACIGLAALHFERKNADEPIAVLPADHFVADVDAFRRTLSAAAELSSRGGIVTIGVVPTAPETGFGYIESGEAGGEVAGIEWRNVKAFVEKPPVERAMEYLATGRHCWNAGIFVFTARTILAELDASMPALAAGLSRIRSAMETSEEAATVAEVYGGLEPVSIDHGVMERARCPVFVVPASFGWSDLGSWPALAELRADERDEAGNIVPAGSVAIDASNCFVESTTGRPVGLLGVRDLVVVDSHDGLLVSARDRAQDVRLVSERIGLEESEIR
ncbi:MAG: mannose-1-phosphate guanylyltransferase [Acidobacteria bacterium]|nr:mannose-1-phosphate guanylyltransferase [Acidobacteriota bacterium]